MSVGPAGRPAVRPHRWSLNYWTDLNNFSYLGVFCLYDGGSPFKISLGLKVDDLYLKLKVQILDFLKNGSNDFD